MSRFLALLVLAAWYIPFTHQVNRIFDDSVNSVQDRREALVAAQIAFPLLFHQVGFGGWNEYAKEKPISELVVEEEREERELGKVKPEREASREIDRARTNGLIRELYHSQYSTVLLDGTLTIMGTANDSYTERSIYLRTGGGMIIPCMLASIPMDSFLWFDDAYDDSFNNKFSGAFRVNDKKKQLSVHDARPHMSGIYWCSGTHNEQGVKNVVYLYVYRIADPGLMLSVFFRTISCDEEQVALRQQQIMGYLCGNESFENCVDESVSDCRIEAEVESNLTGRLQLNFIRYDTECEDERTGQCGAERKIARILEKHPFKDLHSEILRYITEDDRKYDVHSGEYLFDSVRTLAEGYYMKHQVYRCPPGFITSKVENKPACLPCFSGTSKASLGRGTVCKQCDFGSYAPSAALQYCFSCPPQLGTITKRRANKRQDQCFTHQPKPTLGMDFKGFDDNEQAKRKRWPMTDKTKLIIAFTVGFFIIVAVTGGCLCYVKRQQMKQRKKVDQPLKVPGPGEKLPLAPVKVPSVVTLPTKPKVAAVKKPLNIFHEIPGIKTKRKVRFEARKGKAKYEDKSAEAKNDTNKVEDSATEKTKAKEKDDVEKEAKKAIEGDEDMAAEAKKLKASDPARRSKLGRRSHSSQREKALKTIRAVTPLTPGLATPVHFTNQITAQRGFHPLVVVQPVYPSQIVAQPGNIPQFGYPPKMVPQSGYPPQIVAQPPQIVVQPGNIPQFGYPPKMVPQSGYPPQIVAQPPQMVAQPGNPPQMMGQPGKYQQL